MERSLNLRRSTAALVIDHITPHFGLGTLSIHYLEKNADGHVTSGGDIDGVSTEELGLSTDADIFDDVQKTHLVAFVTSLSDELPVTIDVVPPAPVETEEDTE